VVRPDPAPDAWPVSGVVCVTDWERITRENAAAEWDEMRPAMPRERWIEWHVKMVRAGEVRRAKMGKGQA